MISDALTKPGVFPQLMHMLTTGTVVFSGTKKIITSKRILHVPDVFTEGDLERIERYDGNSETKIRSG